MPQPMPAYAPAHPKITLGGHPVESTGVTWALVPGVEPHTASFTVERASLPKFWPPTSLPGDLANEGGSLQAPVSLDFDVVSLVRGVEIRYQRKFARLYHIGRRVVDRENAEVTIADRRTLWTGTVTGRFNVPARVNDFDLAEAGETIRLPGQLRSTLQVGQAGKDGELSSQIIAQGLARQKTAWRRWSLRQVPGTAAEPWTALEIVRAILVGRFVYQYRGGEKWTYHPGLIPADQVVFLGPSELFSDYQPYRVELKARPVKEVLAEMLALARANLYIRPDGNVVVYPIDSDDLSLPGGLDDIQRVGSTLANGSAFLYRTDFMSRRPSLVRCYAEREYELDSTAVSETDSAPDDAMNNVCALPAEKELTVNGVTKRWPAGSMAPIEAVCAAYGIDTALIRQHWNLEGALVNALKESQGIPKDAGDTEIDGLAASFRTHYRQTFQVHPSLVDVMLSVTNVECTVIDPSGRRAPARVWCRYGVVPGFRFADRFLPKNKDAQYAGWNVDATNVNAISAPFFVEVVDPELGIIRIVAAQDMQNGSAHVGVPSGFDATKDLPRLHLQNNGADWGNIPLEESFRLTVRLTFRFADPNDERQFSLFEVKPGENVKALAPPVDVLITRDTARYSVNRSRLKLGGILGDLGEIDLGPVLVNAGILHEMCAAEAKRIYLSWRDRWASSGDLRFGGGHDLVPHGPINYVAWEYRDGDFNTLVNIEESRSLPRTEQLVARDVQAFLDRRPATQ